MEDNKTKLRSRLERVWQPPNLFSFFKTFAKNPPHLVKKGTILFDPGDPLSGVYFIQSGFIKLYRLSEDGKDTIIYLTGPGSLLGLRALISENECAHHYTEALTDCQIINLSRKEYFEILTEHPEFLVDLMHIFIDRLNHAERRVEGFITTDAKSRVANFLYDCAIRFGQKEGKVVSLPIPLTHQRIAEFVGSFRETVTLAMHHLEKEGAIKDERGKITILNLKKLEQCTL